MPNDKEKVVREMHKKMMEISTELTKRELRIKELQDEMITLARESIERDILVAKLEAEVIAMRDAMPRWVSAKDRLPRADRKPESGMSHDTIVLCEHGFINIGWCQIDSGRWYSDFAKGGCLEEVTHWMPMPEPPTQETTQEGGE
tara:strand:+ start:500 stop:934 length:435 start_codon:yes stop_codon:yes gene_type:complete